MPQTFDVQIHSLRARRRSDRKAVSYELGWVVGGDKHYATFKLKGLATSEHAKLVSAAKRGDAFDTVTGQPVSSGLNATPTLLEVARRIYADEWRDSGGKTRKSTAENLAHVVAVVTEARHQVDGARRELLYQALYQGGLSPEGLRIPDEGKVTSRRTSVTRAHHDALRWLERASLPVGKVDIAVCETALRRLAINLDGSTAKPTARTRRRAGLSKILEYAVRHQHLSSSPLRTITTRASNRAAVEVTATTVAHPELIPAALRAVAAKGPRGPVFAAFLACVFYAGLRPSEAASLQLGHCELPETGWGRLRLRKSAAAAGTAWTDSGAVRDDRGLKRRQAGAERPVPIPPVLVQMLREFAQSRRISSGLLFTTGQGSMLSESEVGEFWRAGRRLAMPDAEEETLARVYDLRHAAASLWLRDVPVGVVAARLGHSPEVCLRVYHHLIPGDEERWNEAIAATLPAW
ncbi:site-specific integrase [Terrabacter tumescens]|uniref:Site-specific integrase n=1 Tax=Terrabacter tumescens TaxID=60443 RepID=A0ABQ2IH49_9MICO|nr:tyrosine-type recombinase/integrase [Terrabacter tumescens]GGN07673.1 site-specific integrase [Terrabacter tumescens]